MTTEVTQSTFKSEVLESSTPVLVDFWAEWCGPCRSLSPILEEIAKNRKDIKITKVNIDENPDLAMEYRIQSIPFMAIFKNGKIESTKVGLVPQASLDKWISDTI